MDFVESRMEDVPGTTAARTTHHNHFGQGASDPLRQHRKADIDRKLRDLLDNKIWLRKAVDTIVMGYLPSTSGNKRQEAEDYARRLLWQLTHGISTTFQRDRQTLLKILSVQVNALTDRQGALVNQIKNEHPSRVVEQAIQHTPTKWLLIIQT